MKNLKKLISVIIAVIMIVGSFATVSAADYADVESTNSYYKAIQVLSGLGIAKGDEAGNFNPTADVKRSEMVTFICRAMGEEDIAAGAAGANFTDVAANHWAAGYIAWGVNRGIINGMGDGTFAPDAPVKYQDAVVMIMRALGYDRIAQRAENGGYPTGYLKVASQYGVLTGAGYDSTKAATREIIAQLTNNALTAPIVEVSQYGLNPEDDRYVIHDANATGGLKCLLSTTNKIYRVRAEIADSYLINPDLIKEDGNKVEVKIDKALDYKLSVVENAMDVSFTKIEEIDEEEVVVPAEIPFYVADGVLADATTGEVVELYITEDEDLNAWVILAAVGSKSTVSQTVKYAEGIEADDADYIFEYKENPNDSAKKIKEIEVEGDAKLYVNNVEVGTAADIDDELIANAAEFTFTKAKSADKFTSVFATVYEYYVVKEVSAAKERIYFRVTGSLKLDVEARDNEKFFYNLYNAEGKAIALEDIKADDVLNVVIPGGLDEYENINDSEIGSMAIYVTSNTVEGTVNEEVDENTFVIEGEEYISAIELEANESGKFYVSIDGKIIDVDTTVDVNKNFAVVSFAEATTKMGKSTFEVDLLTKDGKIESYTLASKVKIFDDAEAEGKNYSATTTPALSTKFVGITDLLDDVVVTDRLITFKVNADGDISEIRMPGYYGFDNDEGTVISGEWDADFEEIDGQKAQDATLLIVPSVAFTPVLDSEGEETGDFTIDEEEVIVASFADMANEQSYTATIFQTEEEAEDAVFTFAIGTDDFENAWAEAPLAVVSKITTSLVDGERVKKITFVQSGEVKYLTTEGSEEDFGLATGDVFQYAVNAKGEIDTVNMIVDLSAGIALAGDLGDLDYKGTAKHAYAIGYLAATVDGGFKLADNLADDDGNADFEAAATRSIRFVEADANTYAKIDLYGLSREDKTAIKAIELMDIEASKDTKEVVVVLVKIDENGKAADVVVFEDAKNGLVELASDDEETPERLAITADINFTAAHEPVVDEPVEDEPVVDEPVEE